MKVMSGLDARFLYSETPTGHMHTMKVVVVDVSGRRFPLEEVGIPSLIEERLQRMPMLRRRVIPMPRGLGNPVVVDDPDFDIARHLRFVTAPEPGGQHELDRMIAAIAGVALPRDRPLWELTVVDGLAGGHVAFVMKLHHAIADGVASVAMLDNAFVVDESEAVAEPFSPEPLPSRRRLLRASMRSGARAARTAPRAVSRTVTGLRHARAVKRSLTARVPGPFAGPRAPFNVSLTTDRTFAGLEVPLEDLLAAKKAAGASLNETFLGLCGGALHRYMQRLGRLPRSSLIASVPMATRTDRHRLSGNHVDNLYLPLRNDVLDPRRRIESIRESSIAARQVREEFGSDLFEWRSGLVPAAFHGVIPRLWGSTHLADRVRPPLNLIASCVRGPRDRLELEGGVVTSLFSSGPILEGIGLNVTAWSYAGTMFISVLGCSASLPDPWALTRDMAEELDSWSSWV
ncbi:MAG: wax ester/triacylglycerol synthase family O-acyltransferase [Acidimicrobiales bacterium]|nr:wax ester/triacylglycerol synthase family O-acyltransferase [Acidimicrobiales bacterium]